MNIHVKRIVTIASIILFSSNNFLFGRVNHTLQKSQQAKNSLVALPYAYYTPETKFAFGVGSIYSFRAKESQPGARPSNVKIAATYTQRKQIILSFIPEIYFRNEKYFYNGFYTFYKYPDKYWGLGNNSPDDAEEDFTPDYFKSFTNIQWKVIRGLYIGLRYQFENIKLINTDNDGVLQNKTVPGSEGGVASGVGFLINYDTRNHVYYPSKGQYYQVYAVFFDDRLGSDYRFSHFTFDLREYHSLFKTHVLALHVYNIFINGTPPFQMLALLGGSYWMRGYYFGRYRDKNMVTFQAEYRFPLFWRFGGVSFAGFGDVAPKLNTFEMKQLKVTAGAGLRFTFDRQEKINARLDFGFGNDGNFGFYAMVVEAF